MNYADVLAPYAAPTGLMGAEVLAWVAYFFGDYRIRPRTGDLPYRWGRVAWQTRKARERRFAVAVLGLLMALSGAVLMLISLVMQKGSL
jgi:hypothetical protein